MKSLKIIEDYVINKGAGIERIVELVLENMIGEFSLFAYTSALESLGTGDSDLDIYVIYQSEETYKKLMLIKTIKIGLYGELVHNTLIHDLKCDIEYWKIDKLNEIGKKIIVTKGIGLEREQLKIFHRLYVGCELYNGGLSKTIHNIVNEINIGESILNNYLLLARSIYDDAYTLAKYGEWIPALSEGRQSMLEVLGAYNALNGHPNLKRKWVEKIFIDNMAFGNDELLQKFYVDYLYIKVNKNNINTVVSKLLYLVQDILIKIEMEI